VQLSARTRAALGYLSPTQFEDDNVRQAIKSATWPTFSETHSRIMALPLEPCAGRDPILRSFHPAARTGKPRKWESGAS
jgi:hypothetical protein